MSAERRAKDSESDSANYRSAPAILKLVSAMARRLGGEEVVCADEIEWSTHGVVRVLRFHNTFEEAEGVLDEAGRLMAANDRLSIGVVARAGSRKRWIEDLAADRGLDFECWDRGVDSHAVRTLLHRCADRWPADRMGAEELDEFELMCLAECPPTTLTFEMEFSMG